MGFLLHCLREDDEFIDVGANAGSYSILAGSVIGAKTLAVEPVAPTFNRLVANLKLNGIERSCRAINIGLGAESGTMKVTVTLDTTNHIVLGESLEPTTTVQIRTLDDIAGEMNPTLIKIDVEGWEAEVLRGGLSTLKTPQLLALIVELNGSGK